MRLERERDRARVPCLRLLDRPAKDRLVAHVDPVEVPERKHDARDRLSHPAQMPENAHRRLFYTARRTPFKVGGCPGNRLDIESPRAPRARPSAASGE